MAKTINYFLIVFSLLLLSSCTKRDDIFLVDNHNEFYNVTSVGLENDTIVDYIQFNTSYMDSAAEGKLQWNADDGTLEFGMPGSEINLQIGQETLIRAKAAAGQTILNGDLVYVSGASISRAEVSLATAANYSESYVLGMATSDIDPQGYVTFTGLVRGLNTDAYSEGEVLWLSETPGEFTNVKPNAPSMSVFVGYVIASHLTEGSVAVRPVVVPRFRDTSEVYCPTSTNNSFARWNSVTKRFECTGIIEDLRFPASSIKVTGSTNVPDFESFRNGTYSLAFSSTAMEQAFISFQLPHDRIENSTLYPHFHWAYKQSGATGNVTWCMEYTCADINDVFPETTTQCTTDTAETVFKHLMANGITIPNTLSLSAMCNVRMYRDPLAATDNFNADAHLQEFDVHYWKN